MDHLELEESKCRAVWNSRQARAEFMTPRRMSLQIPASSTSNSSLQAFIGHKFRASPSNEGSLDEMIVLLLRETCC